MRKGLLSAASGVSLNVSLAGLFCLLLVLLPAAAHAQDAPPSSSTIYLQAGAFDPLSPAFAAAASADEESIGPYYLVQFAGPVEAVWLEQVAALGGEAVGYVPNDTHIVRMAPEVVARVQSLPSVRWVGPYRAAYRVAPELGTAYAALGSAAATQGVELVVMAFPGTAPDALAATLVARGAEIVEAAPTAIGPVLRVRAPLSAVPQLAQISGVSWVERYSEPQTSNAAGRKVLGAEAVWETYGYFGEGQIVAISDSGLSVQGALSADFGGRLIRGFAPSEMNLASPQCSAKTTYTDLNGHGTHVAGSVLGNGTRSGSNAATHTYAGSHAGTAPEARLVFMALNTDGSGGIQCVDVNGAFLAKGYEEGARVSSNSWGASNAGGYNLLSSIADDFIWRHKDYLVLYAAGNAGPGAQTVGAPGTAKNVLTIGASENNRPDIDSDADDPNSMASFSSRGPTADGRIKPEVVAPGTWVLSVRAAQAPDGSFWGNFNEDYAYMGGTSMATPLAAGGAAIVREWLNKGRGIAAPSSALLKAIIVNGATQLPDEGVASNNSGYGRMDLKNTLSANYVVMDDHVQGLQTGNVVSYTVQVVAAGAQGTLFALGAPDGMPDGAIGPSALGAAGAMQFAAPITVGAAVAAAPAITTPQELRGAPLAGYDAPRMMTPIPDAPTGGKGSLLPLPNAAPARGLTPQAGAAGAGTFQPPSAAGGLAAQAFQQQMVGGGDFEDPGWTDIWSSIWLGSGVPVRTGDPAFVVAGDYSMWLGGTPSDDALYYPVQFPDVIDDARPSGIAFDVRIIDQEPGIDFACVALLNASGSYLPPYAPDNPQCIDVDGLWSYELIFSAAERAALAGQTAYLVVFTAGDGAAPHMSAFVDNISLVVDFPTPQATITPAAGPPGTTFLLTGKYNVPYGWVDICISPCTQANYITTVYADAAGNIAAFLESSPSIAPGLYPIQTYNLADRTAETSLTISGASQPQLNVAPSAGPAGTSFAVSGSDFLPNDQGIAVTVNGDALGNVGSNEAGEITFTLNTATNTPPGAYTVEAIDSAGRGDTASFTVAAVEAGEPRLAVQPASGAPGTTFTFAARNFTASAPALVTLDGQALGEVNIDAGGRVTLTLATTGSTAPARYTLAIEQDAKRASAEYEVTGGGGAEQSGQGFYVTLVWTDPPAQPAAGQMLVNDLDVQVNGPGGPFFPNGGTGPDRTNNVEALRLQQPAAGNYVITVRAERVNGAFGSQPFALVATTKQNFGGGQNNAELGQTNGGILRGVVFADLDRDGVRDTGEPGISGARVVVRQMTGALTREALTNGSGAYEMGNLPAGGYSISVLLGGGLSLTQPGPMNKTVAVGNNTAPAIGAAVRLNLPDVRK